MQKKKPATPAIRSVFPSTACWIDSGAVITLLARTLRCPSRITYTYELAGWRLVRGHGGRADNLRAYGRRATTMSLGGWLPPRLEPAQPGGAADAV